MSAIIYVRVGSDVKDAVVGLCERSGATQARVVEHLLRRALGLPSPIAAAIDAAGPDPVAP